MSPSISLMPHAVCWKADPALIWTMAITNAITFLSYFVICLTLLKLVSRTRKVIARDWAWFCIGFALFIVACGSTHLMDVVTTWIPFFWLDAATNIITAILSAYVAFMLVRRSETIGFSINDYAGRLADTENEKARMQQTLLALRKLDDWSRMSAAIAHEISNPVEAIQNLLYLIRESEGVTPDIADLATTAQAEAERVITISRSTLSFFRQTSVPEPIDLFAAADSVKGLLVGLLAERKIRMVIEVGGETNNADLTVEALPGEVRQVLLNLVRNACEASQHPNSQITVTLTAHPDGVEIVVADQGSGIPLAILPTLFTFGISTKGQQGNGMGLWTVKHILSRHGGDIRVESVPNQGSRFILWWPRRFPEHTATELAEASA
ncbi:MAG: HAMP domain-containing sensor histidine kinase [Acidobacteriota bacterium]